MPLRDKGPREWLELGLRVAAMVLLAWALWLALWPMVQESTRVRVASGELDARLADWARRGAPDSVFVAIDSVPGDTTRSWLVALRRAGTAVSWSGNVAPIAIAAEPANAPEGGVHLLVAAPRDSTIALRDVAGPIDTVQTEGTGAALRVPAIAQPATAMVGTTVARAHPLDSLSPGRVLVLGTAGWEARYIVTALEEAGWDVDARLTIGPGLRVDRGSPGAIDTARYAAVIALDSAVANDGQRLASYARSGGGVVLGGVAARSPGIRDVAPARIGERVRPAAMSFTSGQPRRALGFFSLTNMRPDAVLLESRDGRAALAARRVGAGRVLQIGYDETWRWRMQGGAEGPEAHRRWWSAAIAATARRVAVARDSSGVDLGAAAPLAALTASFGPSQPPPVDAARPPARQGTAPWMVAVAALLLLAEWASRRTRGAV